MSALKTKLKCSAFEFECEIPLVLFGIPDVANSMIQNLIPSKKSAEDDSDAESTNKPKVDSGDKFTIATGLMLAAALGLSAIGVNQAR